MNEPLTTSRWLRETLSIFGAQAGPVLKITGVVYGPVVLLAAAGVAVDLGTPYAISGWEAWSNLSTVVLLLLNPLATAALVEGVFRHLRGERISAGRSLREMLSRVFAVVGLGIVTVFAVFAGTMLCIVPGIIVQCALIAAPAALIVERAGVFLAWRRSFDLTDGWRWPIFGIIFLLGLVNAGIGGLLVVSGVWIDDLERMFMFITIGNLLSAWLLTPVSAIAATLIYHDLRVEKEGIDEEELVAVFA